MRPSAATKETHPGGGGVGAGQGVSVDISSRGLCALQLGSMAAWAPLSASGSWGLGFRVSTIRV